MPPPLALTTTTTATTHAHTHNHHYHRHRRPNPPSNLPIAYLAVRVECREVEWCVPSHEGDAVDIGPELFE